MASGRPIPPMFSRKHRANTVPEEVMMSRRREYKDTMSRLGRSAGKAACTTPEQARVQRSRQMLQKIRMNLSEARYDTTYETSDTLTQMQEALMKRMEGDVDNPGGKSEAEIEEECTKNASDTLEQMKIYMNKSKPTLEDTNRSPIKGRNTSSPATTPEGYRGRTASIPCAATESSSLRKESSSLRKKSSSVHRTLRAATSSEVHMAVAEVHAVQDDD